MTVEEWVTTLLLAAAAGAAVVGILGAARSDDPEGIVGFTLVAGAATSIIVALLDYRAHS